MINVLYIHGMGGGSDSRIPSMLHAALEPYGVDVIARTYDFNPSAAALQIESWVEELDPALIIGESLGALHAIRIKGVPHLFVSPALNAPIFLYALGWMTFIPGVTWLFDRIYRPREGDRQALHFNFSNLKGYLSHRKSALENSVRNGSKDVFFAFFGSRDHYRNSGVVSVRTWKKYFGDSFDVYDGTHFMEEEYIYSKLLPMIFEYIEY